MNADRNPADLLAICTRNRPRDIEACFDALIKCPDVPMLVLVVDSSDDEGTKLLCESLNKTHGDQLQVVHTWARPGLPHQRNVALDLAPDRCEIVFFIDDDSLAVPGYFDAIRRVFLDEPHCVGVGATVRAVDHSGRALAPQTDRHGRNYIAVREFLAAVFVMRPRAGRVNAAAINGALVNDSAEAVGVDWLSGCAMSFRLAPARITRFNEDDLAGYALGEDMEFCVRISRHGTLMLAPDTYMRHVLSPTNRLDQRNMARMFIVNRHSFVSSIPERFSRAAYWWSVVGSIVLAVGARNWPGAAGIFDGVSEIAAKGARTGLCFKRQKRPAEPVIGRAH